MKKIIYIFLITILFSSFIFCDEASQLKEITAAVDELHEFTNYLIDFEITIMKGDEPTDKMSGLCLFKSFNENILVIKSPEKEKGKAVLQKDALYYIYFPSIKKTQPVNASSKLFGDVNSSDVLKPPFKENYTSEYVGEKDNIVTVQFNATTEKVPYKKQIVYFNNKTKEITYIEYYSKSDKLLKTAYYQKYEQFSDGKKHLVEIKIVSVLGQSTFLKFLKHKKMNFSNNYFTPSGLNIAAESF
ncbi:MAG: hypothetical protein A2086_16160 [Spirochaetes bacterium GWD1_27_9]|nr:MAG: hypothetical protein A2Z98_07070 [Spirochaetes bacterium GWB1_27_13]OHD21504.1 MAG: hypothetical protein A2Y34_01500 [Spirochaetes bacterium GWC1_27_15]OHD44186.1 MAG: hypothetical protein A2086_16160 [Spirochaetes bacterium GWD1_27_9]